MYARSASSTSKRVRRFFDEVWSRADLGRATEHVTPDCVLQYRGKDLPAGPDALVRVVGRWRRAFPDLRFEVQEVVAEGELAAARIVHRGTHRGEWRGTAHGPRNAEREQLRRSGALDDP